MFSRALTPCQRGGGRRCAVQEAVVAVSPARLLLPLLFGLSFSAFSTSAFQVPGSPKGAAALGWRAAQRPSFSPRLLPRSPSSAFDAAGIARRSMLAGAAARLQTASTTGVSATKLLSAGVCGWRLLGGETLKLHSRMQKPRVVFVLGGPGAGKGTQCSRIQKEFNIPHLSAGDCLREEQANPCSPYAHLIDTCIREGKIVPVEITLRLLLKKMLASGFRGLYLIDGFPRNEDNLTGWLRVTSTTELPKMLLEIASEDSSNGELQIQCGEALQQLDAAGGEDVAEENSAVTPAEALPPYAEARQGVVVAKCFFFECSDDVLQRRVQQRGHDSGSHRRADDNAGALAKRLKTHAEQTLPLLDFFRRLNLLETIDAERSIEEVWETVRKAIQGIEAEARRR